ncbi:phage minor head protein [Acinetobacter baumannii]|uniref:phage head morphogenesis protein n=1 Tax=Acinetobacter baumannii TaxID=470 RepID=UPI0024DE0C15|nr:phage minor head protein [Acinetobacter baumannii]MDK2129575.1 phage minor head protein [Acinetobacter baumannii]MDK2160221.1 phage minor head protein [Acinetobacter baumannii]MDK2167680.1 phage minor head protein [Acinetobacter baumannii]MDK2251257.1 phage minor head protein [Acinetobacter baumannii]MDK2262462.1 phage minor head protein [Acinetobacter baumannii]
MPTAQRPELNALFTLPPEDAISYLEKKGFKIGWDWHETLDNAHSKAFTVAKVARMDLLQDIRQSLITAMQQGQSLEQWKASITPTLQDKGWWGKKIVVNPEGREQEVQLGSPRRLRTIYETNMQSAFAAGRYKAMLAGAETRPYWEWRHISISNPRKQHVALNGKIFSYDDPFWSVAYPPSEWGCKCRIIARSRREVEGKEILTGKGYARTINEKVGTDRNTGMNVVAKRTQFNIPTKDGTLTFAPAAGFNGSPATSYLIDNVMAQRATDLMGSYKGLKQTQELLNTPTRAKIHEKFIQNALRLAEPMNETSTIGSLQDAAVKALFSRGVQLESPVLFLSDAIIVNKEYSGIAVSRLMALPQLLTEVKQVFWDPKSELLIYVLEKDVVQFSMNEITGTFGVSKIVPAKDWQSDGLELIQ